MNIKLLGVLKSIEFRRLFEWELGARRSKKVFDDWMNPE